MNSLNEKSKRFNIVKEKQVFNTDNNIAIQQEEKLSINSTSKKNNLIFSFSSLNITELSCSEEQFVIFKNKKKKKRKIVSIRPTTGIKPLYTTIATVTMNLIVSAAIVLLNPYVTVYISYKIPPFALSVHIPDVSTSIYVEVDSKVLLGLPSCDKAFVR